MSTRPFKPAGATQGIAVTTSSAATAFDNTSADYFLIQGDQTVTGNRGFVALGGSGKTVTLTTGIAIHAGTDGVVIKRDPKTETHIAAIGSAALNLLVTPVVPL